MIFINFQPNIAKIVNVYNCLKNVSYLSLWMSPKTELMYALVQSMLDFIYRYFKSWYVVVIVINEEAIRIFKYI